MQILQAAIDGLLMAGVYSLIALGLSLIFGVMKITNFAHGALMTLGMYVAYQASVSLGLMPYLALPLALIVLFLVGFGMQRLLIHPIRNAPTHNQLLVTLGASMVLENLILLIWSPNYKNIAVPGFEKAFVFGGFTINKPRLIAFFVAVLVTCLIYLLLYRTDLGRAIRATSMNQEGAELMGISIKQINAIAFGIGTMCAGAAGVLVTPMLYVYPTIGGTFQLKCFVIAVLGGMGSLWGALIAGLIVGIAESLSGFYLGGTWSDMVIYAIFVLVLLFKPTGLMGKRNTGE